VLHREKRRRVLQSLRSALTITFTTCPLEVIAGDKAGIVIEDRNTGRSWRFSNDQGREFGRLIGRRRRLAEQLEADECDDGVEIERVVMADWMGHLAWWIAPLVEMTGAHVMSAPVIHADDTPIKVLAPGKGRTATGRLWIYAVDEQPWAGERAPAAFYRCSPDRKGERPAEHLAGFSSFLQADAYAGYALPGITHVRRSRAMPATTVFT